MEMEGVTLLHCFRQRRTVLKQCFGPFPSLFPRLKHSHHPFSKPLFFLPHYPESSHQHCHVAIVSAGMMKTVV
jgi:hypothetical protein